MILMQHAQVNGSRIIPEQLSHNGILKDELGFQGFTMCDWLSQVRRMLQNFFRNSPAV